MASDMVLRVKGDIKDAEKKLKELGANVEVVEAKTKKATEAQSLWDKTIQKGSGDSVKALINLGAKYTSVIGAVTLASKFLKSSIDEALKVNDEAARTVEKVSGAWNEIKANLGNALLDSITPALEELYGWLIKISDWQKNTRQETKNRQDIMSLASDSSNAYKIVQGYSKEEIASVISDINIFGHPDHVGIAQTLQDILANYDKILEQTTARTERELLNQAELLASFGIAMEQDPKYGFGIGVDNPTLGRLGFGNGADRYQSTFGIDTQFDWKNYKATQDALNFKEESIVVTAEEISAELDKRLEWLARGDWFADNYSSGAESSGKSLEEILNSGLEAWENYYSTITSYAQNAMASITSFNNARWENEIKNIENSEMAEEDKAEKIDEINRKIFESEKSNSIAQVAIDTASSIMNIWADYASNPVYAGVLTALATATGAAQLGTISAQQYHAFAEGGIVSQPIHAMIGEGAEKEAIMPLSKLKDFVSPSAQGGVINLTVNVSDSVGGRDIASEVYYGIEKAQRTGLLPRWRYAS